MNQLGFRMRDFSPSEAKLKKIIIPFIRWKFCKHIRLSRALTPSFLEFFSHQVAKNCPTDYSFFNIQRRLENEIFE